MHKCSLCSVLCKTIVSLTIILLLQTPIHADEEFPLREEYPELPFITLSDLATEYDSVVIVDVRSRFEYDVIHINKAKHVAMSNAAFGKNLEEALGGDKSKKVVTYCNGHTCAKSYKAARKAQELGFTNPVVFDAGIFEWTMAYPERSTLIGKSPAEKSKIITEDQFNARRLDVKEFEERIAADPKAFVIDARDPVQRKKNPTYKVKPRNYPMDKLVTQISDSKFKKKINGRKLYIYDAVGKQVRWLQYHLEENEIKDYYFLKGGVRSVFE